TVVVDDIDMRITHVIRGDDHLNNTPRQIHIFQALEAKLPRFAHMPLILGPDGRKLSKRHGTVSVLEYRDQGFLPEALLNYLVRLGWSHGDQEIFSREEMIELFDIREVNKSAAAINPDKLLWLNQHYLRQADPGRLAALLEPMLAARGVPVEAGPPLEAVAKGQRERTRTLVEMAEQSLLFFGDAQAFDVAAARKHLGEEARAPLMRLRERLAALADWDRESLQKTLEEVAAEAGLKIGKIAQPLRVAVTGGPVSPAIDVTLELLGRERTLARLDRAFACMDTGFDEASAGRAGAP